MDEESGAVRIHCYVQECKKAPIKSEANVVRRTDGRIDRQTDDEHGSTSQSDYKSEAKTIYSDDFKDG